MTLSLTERQVATHQSFALADDSYAPKVKRRWLVMDVLKLSGLFPSSPVDMFNSGFDGWMVFGIRRLTK